VLVLERPQQLDLRLEPLQLLRGSHDPAGYLHFGPRHLDAVHRVEAFVAATKSDHVMQQTPNNYSVFFSFRLN